MRVSVHGFFRFRNVHLCQQLNRAVPRRLFADLLMRADLFHNLPADGINRGQRRHRVLENHRNLAAPQMSHLGLPQAHQFAPPVFDRPCDHRIRIGDQAHHRQQRHRLARPGFAGDAQHLALVHIKRHAVNRPHQALFGAEGNLQITNLQNHCVRTRGSSII